MGKIITTIGVAGYVFVMYCVLRVASLEDRWLEQHENDWINQ